MRQIDGLVTKDEIYRLISGFRTRFKISEEAGHEMAERVADMPTIEVEPVKHAQWIRKHNSFPQRYFCTNCGEGAVGRFAFCPHCGYKMGVMR